MPEVEQVVQLWILAFSGACALMISRTDGWHRWGHVMGLISQPAYFYTTWKHGQWAIFALTCWYTYYWCQGIKNRFLR